MSRYFIAVVPEGLDANPTFKQLIGKLKRTLDGRKVRARWVASDLWHVTLVFLGELNEMERDRLLACMQNRPRQKRLDSEIDLRLQGIGAFPEPLAARVLWAGVQENRSFLDLRRDLVTYLVEAGFDVGDRQFHPHLTLARLRNPHSLNAEIALGGRKHFGDYKIREWIVFESVLQGNILKYMPRLRLQW